MDRTNDALNDIINFLAQIKNKDRTLKEVLDELIKSKIRNAEISTENLIKDEIQQCNLLLNKLKNN